MPKPSDLAAYEQVLPGAAERIMAMAESAVTGRIDIDKKLADAEIEQARTGMSLAFILTLIALVAAIVFFAIGKPIAGGALLSMPVVMLIKSFLEK